MLTNLSLSINAQDAGLSLMNKSKFAWNLSDLANVQSNGISVMTTFSCGGGSSMGYKLAGCDVMAANDIDPEMAWHYKKNLKPKHYFLCPISDLLTAELPDELFNLDILDGSPPCSTFSSAGSREAAWGKEKFFREGQQKQILSDLFFDFLNLVDRLKPRVVIAENVKGMLLGNAKGYTKLVVERFKEIGYRPQVFLINAADCGVPQKRERVFFCAVRSDVSQTRLTLTPQCQPISCQEATVDLNISANERSAVAFTSETDKKWWPLTPPGKVYSVATKKITGTHKLWSHRKLCGNSPSFTLKATHHTISHWSEPRLLTFKEYKRLGSFPDDYIAKNDDIGKYMVGMSVPPLMTKAVADAVISQWLIKV